MAVIILLSIAIHSCYLGSKVVLSLFALELRANQFTVGAAPVFWMNALNLAVVSYLSRK
jgi:hypothetical protein